jgi:hypothetical protein
MDNFIHTEFGLLPPKNQFIIPTAFRDNELEQNRSFYSNKNFLEILKSQPSLYEEHKFLYEEAANDLYKKFMRMLDDPESEFIKIESQKIEEIDCYDYESDDFKNIYNLSNNTVKYNKRIESQFANFVENNFPIFIMASYDSDSLFSMGYSMNLKKIKGEYLKTALRRLKNDTFNIINDTIHTKCDGEMSTNEITYNNFIKAAIEIASMMNKEFSFKLISKPENKLILCDLYRRYAKGKNIDYINISEYEKFKDKNNILSLLFSPSLFRKIDPFAEELSSKFKKILYDDYEECEEYTNDQNIVNKVMINDIMTEERKEMYKELNETVRRFYINLRDTLTEDELKEFLTESLMFDEKNEARYLLIKNMIKLSKVIIKEYDQLYKERDRQLIIPTDKFYVKMIPKGTLLYRGYKKIYGPINDKTSFSFFSLNPIYLFSYIQPESNIKKLNEYFSNLGGIATFRLTKDIYIMDFSNLSSIKYMKKILKDENAPSHVIEAFDESWRIIQEAFIRSSYEKTDLEFMSWLCSKGYGGYVGMDIEDMHDEISLCFSTKDEKNNRYIVEEDIEYIGTIEPQKYMNFSIEEEPYIYYPDLIVKYPVPNLSS